MINTLLLCAVLFQDPQVRVESLTQTIVYGSVVPPDIEFTVNDTVQNDSKSYAASLGSYGYNCLNISTEPIPAQDYDKVEFNQSFAPSPDPTFQTSVGAYTSGKFQVKFIGNSTTSNILSIFYFKSTLFPGNAGSFRLDFDNDDVVDLDLTNVQGAQSIEIPMPAGVYTVTVLVDGVWNSSTLDYCYEYLRLTNTPDSCVIQEVTPTFNQASIGWERDTFWHTRFYSTFSQFVFLSVGRTPGNPDFIEIIDPSTHLIVNSQELSMYGTFYAQGFALDQMGNLVTGNLLKIQ